MAAVHEIRMVREVGGPGDEPVFHEHRLDKHDVGQMRAAAGIRVIANEHVAGLEVRKGCGVGCRQMPRSAEMHRDTLGLANVRPAASNSAVEQSWRSLMLVEKAAADQRFAHLLDDGREATADDLDVTGSTASRVFVMAVMSVLDHDVQIGVDCARARGRSGGGVHLLDDGGTVKDVAGAQPVAIVDRTVSMRRSPATGSRSACRCGAIAGAGGLRGHDSSALGTRPVASSAQRDDLDGFVSAT